MPQRLVAIVGHNNTQAQVTGQNELLVKLSSTASSGLATEATLLNVETATQQIETNTTGVERTPNFLRPSGVTGNTPVGIFSVSFASVGTANATVGGIILKPGETLNLDAGALNNTLGTIAYSTTTVGAELIIIFLI